MAEERRRPRAAGKKIQKKPGFCIDKVDHIDYKDAYKLVNI